MVTQTPNPGDQMVRVTQVTPVDVTGLRDPGMRALVLLAASLGWNVVQKVNNPVALVARDGTQRRLPTNTSIRMSVFQAALSTIMVHTEDREATPELIDAITQMVKLDRDHERRLRLAIGETTEDHRHRLANEKAAERKREPDEHLTHRPTVTLTEEPVRHLTAQDLGYPETVAGPYDRQDHGKLVSRKKYMAHHTASAGRSLLYESDSSYERIWEDGYKDYECQICGRIFKAPKGAGSHRQIHLREGDASNEGMPAWKRSQARGVPDTWGERANPLNIPTVEDIVFEEPPEELETTIQVRELAEQAEALTTETANAEEVIDAIAAMVAPHIMASRDEWKRTAEAHMRTIDTLQREFAEKEVELNKLRADWDALRGLIDGR